MNLISDLLKQSLVQWRLLNFKNGAATVLCDNFGRKVQQTLRLLQYAFVKSPVIQITINGIVAVFSCQERHNVEDIIYCKTTKSTTIAVSLSKKTALHSAQIYWTLRLSSGQASSNR